MAKQTSESAEYLKEIELQRLDHLLGALWPAAMTGDCRAVDSCLRVCERRSRLLGLDAPAKIEQAGELTVLLPDTWPITPEEVAAGQALASSQAAVALSMAN